MNTILAVQTDRPTADRSSGRRTRTRWYRVVTAHTAGGQTLIDGFNVEVANTYLGLGTRDAIDAAAAGLGKEVIDFWPIAQPIAA